MQGRPSVERNAFASADYEMACLLSSKKMAVVQQSAMLPRAVHTYRL
jgi:hypothetical protein